MPMTKDEPVAHSTATWVYASGRTNPYPSPLIIIITIIMIIIIDIYRAPFLSRVHSALQIQYTKHKQQSHLITCNLLTKHIHTHKTLNQSINQSINQYRIFMLEKGGSVVLI